jgi:membrane dipeptidase
MSADASLPLALLVLSLTMLVGCAPADEPESDASTPSTPSTMSVEARADSLAQAHLLVDGHIDVPYRLRAYRENIADSTVGGDFDAPRARAGGLDVPFMSIYIPVELQGEPGAAKARADALIDMVEDFETNHPETFEVATSTEDVRRIVDAGTIALPMGMENGAGIEGDLDNLQHFYDRGIRYITLTHAEHNRIGDSSYDDAPDRWNGLSPFGEEVIDEMNRLGIMVDISHVTDATATAVLDRTEAPVLATHSSCRHFTPGWERNMSDALIQRLAENDGVIMINFGSSFLRSEYQDQDDPIRERMQAHIDEQGWAPDSREAVVYEETVRTNNPIGTVQDVADHIDHVVDLVGVEHVGLGSDYDGVFGLPEGLRDASTYPNLVAELLRRGYTDDEIAQILGGNAMRVWREAEATAERLRGS